MPGAQEKFNKGALVTLWIDPAEHQIARFTFDNIGFDFLPLRWLIRLDELTASCRHPPPARHGRARAAG